VVNQFVTDGEAVKKDELLFVINSPTLAANVANRTVVPSSLPYKFDPATGNISVHSNQAGVVDKVNYQVGSFVPTGAVLATVDTVGSLYVAGHFHLSPPDYARVHTGSSMQITFPDNSKAVGTVYSIALEGTDGTVDTIVRARLQTGSASAIKFPVGTPVQASLKLTQQTWWEQLKQQAIKLLKPAGQ
jgi:multidrug resistance efflux pump